MNLSKIPLWLYVAVAGLLGLLWWKSRQVAMQKQAEAEQERQTVRLTNWRLPWEETVTSELTALRDIANAISRGTKMP